MAFVETVMEILPSQFVAQQFLHGYAGGHVLLAGSGKLPPAAARLMLTQSDLSGSGLVGEQSSYLSGYPVTEANSYAVARTWPAPEMPRPGCVWTHTILIRFEDLRHLASAHALFPLFRRPTTVVDKQYEEPLTVSPLQGETYRATRASLTAVLAALYEDPRRAVVVPTSLDQPLAGLVSAIWSQQWPSLRQTCAFSSYSVGTRRLGKLQFDLQVIPAAAARSALAEMDRDGLGAALAEPIAMAPEWLALAARDAGRSRIGGFRRFLWRWGDGLDRPGFAGLAKIYSKLRNVRRGYSDVLDLLRLCASEFPRKDDILALKMSLFCRASTLVRRPDYEASILGAFLAVEEISGVPFEDLDLRERAREFASISQGEALGLYLKHQSVTHPAGRQVISGIFAGLHRHTLVDFLHDRPELAGAVIEMHPEVATLPVIWRVSASEQRERFASFRGSSHFSNLLDRAVAAMVNAGAGSCAEFVAAEVGPRIVGSIFNNLETRDIGPEQVDEAWRKQLNRYQEALTDMVRANAITRISSAAVLSSVLSFSHAASLPVTFWSEVLNAKDDRRQRSTLEVATYCWRLCSANSRPELASAIVQAFLSLHRAMWNSALDLDLWRQLDELLPKKNLLDFWDRCERLRRGLIRRFEDHQWPTSYLMELDADPIAAEFFFRTAHKTKSGRRLIQRLRHDRECGSVMIPASFKAFL